jgi:uncharacterized protein (DUF1778 family)
MPRLRKRMVRPRKKTSDRKEAFIRVRVTDDLKKTLEAAAVRDGMDLSTFARVAMIEKARRAGTQV